MVDKNEIRWKFELSGLSIADWARQNNSSPDLVYSVLKSELYRDCRRLIFLREYPDDKIKIYPWNQRKSCSLTSLIRKRYPSTWAVITAIAPKIG